MIKTAEKWRQEPMFKHLRWTPETVCSVIKAIQLDAIKHGMTIAAELIIDDGNPAVARDNILTARDNLKEI